MHIFIDQGQISRSGIINVPFGQETVEFRAFANGVERKLQIQRSTIAFPAIIPELNVLKEDFTITNVNSIPIEIFWNHLEE